MESLISTFNIDWHLFLAQLINFALVFSILYLLVFKPLIKTMSERTSTIEKGLQEAAEAKKRLEAAASEKESIIAEAKKEASRLIDEGEKKINNRREEMVTKAKEEIGQIINVEKLKLQKEKDETLKEIKKEVASLVVLSLEKVLGEKMDKDFDEKLIKKIVK
jgi:F-type H+-transporting ATPase subunit b